MEREEGGNGQLLHRRTSNTVMLATFAHPGRGSLRHNNGKERRKKNYPTADESLKLTRFSAQERLKATFPQEKENKTEQNSRNSVL